MSPHRYGVLGWQSVWGTLLIMFRGLNCELSISPPGPTLVNALVDSNITLAVSFSGAPDSALSWYMGSLPVVTWTIGSNNLPDIPVNHKDVLSLEPNGSLTFEKIQLNYSNTYKLDITKSGVGTASTTFVLTVYEYIQNVSVHTEPASATEGAQTFIMQYSTLQGEASVWKWYFDGMELTNSSHYTVERKSLVIERPTRNDTGQYTLVLTNPFSTVTTHNNITVLYGPDEPVLGVSPSQPFYVSGDSLSLSCLSEGVPPPSVSWVFAGETLPGSQGGALNLTNIQTSQGGIYTCMLRNEETEAQHQRNVTVKVYESPAGRPLCSVYAVNGNTDLQFHCQWLGGTPMSQLSFPALTNTSGTGSFSLTMSASQNLNGKMVTCLASHPLNQNQCNVTASSPTEFLPVVRTTVGSDGKIAVTIDCYSLATPRALVRWSKQSWNLTNGTSYQISTDTTQLSIRDFNISASVLNLYTCTCSNPLGTRGKDTRLLGPTISDSKLLPNQDGTIITMTWEVPPTSVVTGFDVQMRGPDLLGNGHIMSKAKRASEEFRTIQQKSGSSRSADISVLDPKSTYWFRIIPIAGRTIGHASEVQRIGPGEGLSGPAIAGIAAGIPCSLLFLLILAGLIYLCVRYCSKKRQQTRYPISRAAEKAVASQPDINTPHNLLTGGLKPPPDYSRLQQASSERSVALPSFVPPPPVRFATTV